MNSSAVPNNVQRTGNSVPAPALVEDEPMPSGDQQQLSPTVDEARKQTSPTDGPAASPEEEPAANPQVRERLERLRPKLREHVEQRVADGVAAKL